jgi:hypothetical protein
MILDRQRKEQFYNFTEVFQQTFRWALVCSAQSSASSEVKTDFDAGHLLDFHIFPPAISPPNRCFVDLGYIK